jgi:hypothetical protein
MREQRYSSTPILHLRTRYKMSGPRYPPNKELAGPHSCSWRFGEEITYSHCQESKYDSSDAQPYPSHYADYGIPQSILYIAFKAPESRRRRLMRRDAVWPDRNLSTPRRNLLSPHLADGHGNKFLRSIDNLPGVISQMTATRVVTAARSSILHRQEGDSEL